MGTSIFQVLTRHWFLILWEVCSTPNLGCRTLIWKENLVKDFRMLKFKLVFYDPHILHKECLAGRFLIGGEYFDGWLTSPIRYYFKVLPWWQEIEEGKKWWLDDMRCCVLLQMLNFTYLLSLTSINLNSY